MKVPLHIRQDDFSPEACRARVLLHTEMRAWSPNGWRRPKKLRTPRFSIETEPDGTAVRYRTPPRFARWPVEGAYLGAMYELGKLAGKARILDRIERMVKP